MLSNYFKVAVRNLIRHKVYALVNVVGLAIGFACCLLIYLFVQDEVHYDRFHAQEVRLYRVLSSFQQTRGRQLFARSPMPMGPALASSFPEVEQAVRFREYTDVVRRGTRSFSERLTFADPALFEVFTFPLGAGDPGSVLEASDAVVLSAAAAHKYFGTGDPLGQRLSIKLGEAFSDFVVTGVALPPPGPTSIDFDFVLPFRRVADVTGAAALENWRGASTHTYVLLGAQARPEALEAKMPDFVAQHLGADMIGSHQYRFQRLREVHLTPEVTGGLKPTSSPAYAYILSAIALVVLLLACINFTNLAVARAAARAREVGVRKLVGARRNQLMVQFWGEALLLSGIALLGGLALADLLLPTFNDLAGKTLVLSGGLTTFGPLAGVALLVGLVAGSYPALVLSGFQPVTVLKGRFSGRAPGGARRILHPLIVAQFGLSVFLMISTLVMRQQLGFIEVRNVGFEAGQVVVVPTHSDAGAALLERYRAALDGYPGVQFVSGSAAVPARPGTFSTGYVEIEGGEAVFPSLFRIASDYLETMGLRLTDGRALTDDYASDTTASVLVNEAMVQAAGWTQPIGQRLAINGASSTVVGVVEDFNYESLHHAVGPVVLHRNAAWPIRHILVRIAPEDLTGALSVLEEAWSRVAPELPFEYYFLDEDLARQYEADERWSAIVGYAAFLAMLIACLGLFGLAALSTAQRTKEIGIRKVLGASVLRVVLLLSRDFALLVLTANLLAWPAAYFAMHRWLEDFVYRITPGPVVFIGAGGLALAIALLTVGYQALKVALADPVESLRYE